VFEYFNEHQYFRVVFHEVDWEVVQVGLDSDNQPDVMTFAQHTHGAHCSWSQVEKTADHRPQVYVAVGCHASYPAAGWDHAAVADDSDDASGNGEQETPAQFD
jgi:hypothetical protein